MRGAALGLPEWLWCPPFCPQPHPTLTTGAPRFWEGRAAVCGPMALCQAPFSLITVEVFRKGRGLSQASQPTDLGGDLTGQGLWGQCRLRACPPPMPAVAHLHLPVCLSCLCLRVTTETPLPSSFWSSDSYLAPALCQGVGEATEAEGTGDGDQHGVVLEDRGHSSLSQGVGGLGSVRKTSWRR